MIQQGPLRLLFSFLGPKTPSPGKLCFLNTHKLWCLDTLRNTVIEHALACLCGKTCLDKKTEQKVRKNYQGKCLYFEFILSLVHDLGNLVHSCLLLLLQFLSRVWLFVTPWTAAHQASLSFTNSWSLLKLMSIELVRPSNYLVLCHPLLLPSIFPCIRVFSNESDLHVRWPKYWSFSFNISPSNEYSGLISFRMGWFDLLAVQGTLKSLLQHHSSKASIIWHSAFFMVQLSHSNMTNEKTIALTMQTFISNVMCLLFNMLSRLVIAFLPRNRCLLISWLQLAPAVILKSKMKKIKSVTVSTVSPSIWHEVKGLDAMILPFWILSFKPAFSFSFTFIKRLFSPSLLSAIRVLSSVCLRLLIFLLEILIPACAIYNWYNTFITSLCLA